MRNILKLEIDTNRTFGLDILRASAILFVIISHGQVFLPKTGRKISELLAFDGVSIFFVLSGYLIGGILLKILHNRVDRSSLFDFWIRRWFRTLPNYFLVLVLLIVINLTTNDSFRLQSVLSYFIFSQNLVSPHPAFFPEAWSLTIEEWFYLLIPLLIFSLILKLKLSPRTSVILVAVTILIIVTLFRFHRYLAIPVDSVTEWDDLFRKQVITRLDSLMYGMIGAYLNYCHRDIWIKYKYVLLVTGIVLFELTQHLLPSFVPVNSLYNCVFSFSVISIATLCLLPYLSSLKSGKGFLYKSITYVSMTSYSMYLLNLSVIRLFIIRLIPWSALFESRTVISICKYSLFWVLVIVLSILLYKYFELPMMKLRDNPSVRKFLQQISPAPPQETQKNSHE